MIFACEIVNDRFVPSKFEEIFKKHARTNPNALTSGEVDELLRDNREPKDYSGWYVNISPATSLFEKYYKFTNIK